LPSSDSSRVRARFDQFWVDLSSGELLRASQKVPIQEKPLQVLRLLLESEGKVVTRDSLRSALWPEDTFVDFEHGVNTAVKKLRHALEDSAEHPRFVETLPRIGYRFLVPVEWITNGPRSIGVTATAAYISEERSASPPSRPRPSRNLISRLVLASLVGLFLVVLFSDRFGVINTFRQVAQERHAEAQSVLTQRRLTANPDDLPLTSGVLSPDGRYLAYSDPSGFYLKHIDSGETHRLTFPDGFEPMPESWFPDSVHLVVRWLDHKKAPSLWKISVLGGTPRKLADVGSSARVSPDGLKIAYLAGIWDNEQVWLMQADGSGARKLIDGGQLGFGAVAWAPDSVRFAYVKSNDSLSPNDRAIQICDLASGRSSILLEDNRLGDELAWTSTGRLIYTLRESEPNWEDLNLWSTQLDTKTGLPSAPPTRITNEHGNVTGISMAADGKRMAVRRNKFQPDVFLADLDASGRRLSEPRRFTFDQRWDWPSGWTPDSKGVLFNSDRDGPNQIYQQRIDQTQPDLLVGGPDVVWVGQLTPDGSDLIYAASVGPRQAAGKVRLVRIPLAGGPAKPVLEASSILGYQCARSPSSICIYGQMEEKSEFYRFFTFDPLGAKPPQELAKIKKEDGPNQWSISPNGRYLAMRKTQDPYQGPTMRILEVATGTTRDIPVPSVGLMMGLNWAIDSNSIWLSAYMGRGAYGSRSAVVNVDLHGKARVLFEKLNFDLWSAIPSPDGKHLALLAHTQSSNISLLEDF
jgi:DNA-binding winged helix-turn-helix (wHTH) protein/Tol biopolymer transport system component